MNGRNLKSLILNINIMKVAKAEKEEFDNDNLVWKT